MKFGEFMKEQRSFNRWFVLRVALIGALCGVALAFLWFSLAALQ